MFLHFSYLFFIAKRIYFDKENKKKIFSPSIRIALINISLGIIVIIISISIVLGFKKEVQDNMIGFLSHIQITNIKNQNFYETSPIIIYPLLLKKLKNIPNIHHIQRFILKPAIIKTKDNFQSILLKGVDNYFDWNFLKKKLIAGNLIDKTSYNSVILSKKIADKLHFKINDSFYCYFIQNPICIRKYYISGIYQTNFINYDQLFVLCDIKQILKLNKWNKNMASGIEIFVNNYNFLEKTMKIIYEKCNFLSDKIDNYYAIRSIKQINPIIFSWLSMLNINAVIILILMLLVAGFSMTSGLLIIILEYSNMIGILKAMGEKNIGIFKIFLYLSIFLIGKGLLCGNIIAISIYIIQKYSGIFKLDASIYYVSEIPIHLNFFYWFLINLGTFILTLLTLIIPSCLINRMVPSKIIRFE